MIDAECGLREQWDVNRRTQENGRNVDVYLQNAIFFEGLYDVFRDYAAITKVLPYNVDEFVSVVNRADCDIAPGRITFSMDGVGSMDVLATYVANGMPSVGTNFAHPL